MVSNTVSGFKMTGSVARKMTSIVGRIFNSFYPIVVGDIDEFLETMEREGATFVESKSGRKQYGFVIVPEANTNDFHYLTRYKSRAKNGRPIKFEEYYAVTVGRFDTEANYETEQRIILTVDNRFKQFKERIPNLETRVLHNKGGYLDDQTYQHDLDEATNLGLNPI